MASDKQIILSGLTVDDLTAMIANIVSSEVTKCVRKINEEDLKEKLLSPEETCKLFTPAISKPTLDSYADKGHFPKYYLEGRTWFKYGEVMAALKTLKKYSQQV